MGFKIHKGVCSCGCGKEGLIVVKKGYIAQCNHRIKKEKKHKDKSTPPPSRIFVPKTAEEKQAIFDALRGKYQSNILKQKEKQKLNPKKRTPLKRTAIKKKFPKKTGEGEVFNRIWATREHNCEVCERPIKRVDGGVGMFSHVLSKGADVSMRLDEENILLMGDNINGNCDCHDKWEHRTKEMREIEMWKPIFLLLDAIKTKSNVTNKPNYNFKENEEETEIEETEVLIEDIGESEIPEEEITFEEDDESWREDEEKSI